MKLILHLLLDTIAVFAAGYLIPSARITSFWTAMVVALVLGLLNFFVRPVLVFLTLPINLLTLGLFSFVINGVIILLASYLVPGFYIGSFLTAILFGIVLSLMSFVLNMFK